jgi:hypothetical protein
VKPRNALRSSWLLVWCLWPGLLLAQAEGSAAGGADQTPTSGAAAAADGAAVDEILEGDEEVLEGAGVTYDPGTRRDPFKSLLAAPDELEVKGPRPEGIPGLLIDELDLTGFFQTPRGFVAQVQTSKGEKSYLLKEGDQLYDGDVVSVTRTELVFKQVVNDPTALKPFREVVKKLNP